MKQIRKNMILIVLCIVISGLYPYNITQGKAASSEGTISIDGYFDDWSDKPYSWEYNYNNPYIIQNYWDGTQNITKEYYDENGNPYNLDIRHKMSLYSDGKFVYLYIKVSSNNGAGLYAEDFQFYLDNAMAAFRITYPGGTQINKHGYMPNPGIYTMEVRHRASALSDTVVNGATASLNKKANDLNNEIEIKIPLSAMKQQNPNINLEDFNRIDFFTPNMMYRRIACSGVSSGPIIGSFLMMSIVGGSYYISRRKRAKQL